MAFRRRRARWRSPPAPGRVRRSRRPWPRTRDRCSDARFAARKVDLMRAQEAPDILDMNVAERLGDERPGPVGVTLGRRRLRSARRRRSVSIPYLASAPRRSRSRARVQSRASRRHGGHQRDLRLQARAMLGLRRARQAFELGPLLAYQYDRRCRAKAAHAALNHDSPISDSGYYGEGKAAPIVGAAGAVSRHLLAQARPRQVSLTISFQYRPLHAPEPLERGRAA
jgi:hypothetical protein